MIELMMFLSLAATPSPAAAVPVTTCVWPNRCAVEPAPRVEVAQFQPCVWPNRCSASQGA